MDISLSIGNDFALKYHDVSSEIQYVRTITMIAYEIQFLGFSWVTKTTGATIKTLT